MRREQHRHLHAGATTNSCSSLAAPPHCAARRISPSACSSAQQAAAAWAWFEHGGSSCITPSKAEGLVASKSSCAKLYNSVGAGPSRFKREVLSSRKIPQQSSTGSADDRHIGITKPGRAASRRRHSFDQHHDLAQYRTSDMYNQRFSSSFRSTSPRSFHFDDAGSVDDQDVAKNEEGRNPNSCQIEVCSLLDKYEVEAVCKQLHDRLSPSCRSPCSTNSEPHEYSGSQKVHHDHLQEHLKPRRYIKSTCSTATHKPLADNDHHHNINDAVRRLLHLHVKMRPSGNSTAAAPSAPFLCSSIATANSIVDHHHHHHRRSPKHSIKAETPNNRTSAKQQRALHDWGIIENVGKIPNYSGELKKLADKASGATDLHIEREDFTLGQHKSQQKLAHVPHMRDRELVEEGAPVTPSSLHPSDSKFSKALLPLVISHLPGLSALALRHHKHADKSSKDDGVLGLALSNRHRQLQGDHVHHIHHHHHHYHHHLRQQTKGAAVCAQDTRRPLRDYHLEGHAGAHELQAPKIYRLHKEKLMISGTADHGERHPQHHEYVAAAPAPAGRLQAAAKFKAEKYLWPAALRAAAGTDHVDLQTPGSPLPTF